MRRRRYVPLGAKEIEATMFLNTEEAWFWFIRCQELRREGARFEADQSDMVRPCDPDDIYRAVMSLVRNKKLAPIHLRVLGRYGLRGAPPDPRCREEETDFRCWDQAMDLLTTILRSKGIIPMPET